MKQIIIILVLMLVITNCSAYSDGEGTSGDPYQISTVDDWTTLTSTSTDWDKYFILTADINFNGATITPIGALATKFSGEFDGNNKTLSNFVISASYSGRNDYALFGRLAETGRVKDLIIRDATITATPSAAITTYVGFICGEQTWESKTTVAVNNCSVYDCTITVTHAITQPCYIGSIVGAGHSGTQNCYANSGTIIQFDITASSGTSSVGGCVGLQTGDTGSDETGKTKYCSFSGSIRDINGATSVLVYVGGVVGYVAQTVATYASTVEYCAFTGTIEYDNLYYGYFGGIVGFQNGHVLNCHSSGSITVTSTFDTTGQYTRIGGIAGYSVTPGGGTPPQITDCYSTTTLSLTSNKAGYIGGLIGYAGGPLLRSYYVGNITASSGATIFGGGCIGKSLDVGAISCYSIAHINGLTNTGYIGGFVGDAKGGTFSNCYALGATLNNGSTALSFSAYGGFCGYGGDTTSSTFEYCFAAQEANTGYNSNREPFLGLNANTCTLTQCFWDTTRAGTVTDYDGIEHTTAEMKTLTTYTGAGYDFEGEGQNWKMLATYEADAAGDIKSSYPYLVWQTFPYGGGAGTAANPYEIKNTLQWNWAYTNIDLRSESVYFEIDRECALGNEYIMIVRPKKNPNSLGSPFGNSFGSH